MNLECQHSDDTQPWLRMYILVRDVIPFGIAAVSISHAALACYLEYEDRPAMQNWRHHSFRNVVCWVTDDEFEDAKRVADHTVIAESNFGNTEVAIAFCPRELKEWPRAFRKFRLYDAFEIGQCIRDTRDDKTGVIVGLVTNTARVQKDYPGPDRMADGSEWVPFERLRHLPPPRNPV